MRRLEKQAAADHRCPGDSGRKPKTDKRQGLLKNGMGIIRHDASTRIDLEEGPLSSYGSASECANPVMLQQRRTQDDGRPGSSNDHIARQPAPARESSTAISDAPLTGEQRRANLLDRVRKRQAAAGGGIEASPRLDALPENDADACEHSAYRDSSSTSLKCGFLGRGDSPPSPSPKSRIWRHIWSTNMPNGKGSRKMMILKRNIVEHGMSHGCQGCNAVMLQRSQREHSQSCRARIEAIIMSSKESQGVKDIPSPSDGTGTGGTIKAYHDVTNHDVNMCNIVESDNDGNTDDVMGVSIIVQGDGGGSPTRLSSRCKKGMDAATKANQRSKHPSATASSPGCGSSLPANPRRRLRAKTTMHR